MWIKICGVNDPNQVRAIATLRPDAIGLNFYPQSPRFVSAAVARKISDATGPQIERIGVFVEPTADTLRQAVLECGLSGIQIHSADEEQSLCQSHCDAGRPIRTIRAFRIGPAGLTRVTNCFDEPGDDDPAIDACLIDAHVPGLYGGTGQKAPWQLLRDEYRRDQWPPLILAGGLTAENVAEAIATVKPWGVDVAGGVESSPGVKDVARIARFILEARRAFSELQRGRSSPVV